MANYKVNTWSFQKMCKVQKTEERKAENKITREHITQNNPYPTTLYISFQSFFYAFSLAQSISYWD